MARRVSVSLPARLTVGSLEQGATCVNVSSTGVALTVAQPPPLGTKVGVHLELPSGHKIAADAEVVRVANTSEDSVGVRFLNLSQGSLVALHAYLSELMRTLDRR